LDSHQFDQAEGLRRMLAGPKPRIFSFLSADSGEKKSQMLVNLGASLARSGSGVLLLDAYASAAGISSHLNIVHDATLMRVARHECKLEDAVHMMPQGFEIAALTGSSMSELMRSESQIFRLCRTFDALAQLSDVVMVDAELDEYDTFPLQAMIDGEIVVQVSDSAASIKSAYSIIKRLNASLGRRPFSVLVTGASDQRAQVVYDNMAKAASRYLAIPLNSIGSVPADEHMTRAARLGTTVVDAFPRAGASVAFRRLAGYFASSGIASPRFGISSSGSNFMA